MLKKILALALCLAMVMSFIPVAYAAEEENITLSGDDALNSDFVYYEKEDAVARPSTPFEDGTEVKIPDQKECSCDAGEVDLIHHADNCLRKCYYLEQCTLHYEDVYFLWRNSAEDVRDYMASVLAQTNPDKLKLIEDMWSAAEEGEADITGTASQTVDGTTITANGVPQGSQLSVKDAADDMQAVVDNVVTENHDLKDAVFSYDISVRDTDGEDWQPKDDYVAITMDVAHMNLPKYTRLMIVHVDDNGNSSLIEAMVDENGIIEFETGGFSTFAGFTVDFEYGAAFYSMPGLTSKLLSVLFDDMRMPLQVTNVADVTYTDYSQLTVEKQADGDWLLTSIKPFTTKETLTITMNDGSVYEIKVTDATTHPTIGGEVDYSNNAIVTWQATDDGTLDTPSNAKNDGWSKTGTIIISASGATNSDFYIKIERDADKSANSLKRMYVNLTQIRIEGGANVTVMLNDASGFKSAGATECHIRSNAAHTGASSIPNLFYVEKGSLKLQGHADTKLVISGYDNTKFTTNQLVNLRQGATKFVASDTIFRACSNGAIWVRANNMTTFKMTDCEFGASVSRYYLYKDDKGKEQVGGGRGGHIYVYEYGNDNGNQTITDITTFTLTSCKFIGSSTSGEYTAAADGGSIAVLGRVQTLKIDGCTFTDCSTLDGYGGAVYLGGILGNVSIFNTSFTGCKSLGSTAGGGALMVHSRLMDSDGNTHKRVTVSSILIQKCNFDSCETTKDGGAIDFSVQVHSIKIEGTHFDGCIAQVSSGAVSFGAVGMKKDDGSASYAFTYAETGTKNETQQYFADKEMNYSTIGSITIQSMEVTKSDGTVTTRNTRFDNCKSNNFGGGISFATHMKCNSVTINSTIFKGCSSKNGGSGVYMGNTILKLFNVTNCQFWNCDTKDLSGNYSGTDHGGTFRTIGKTTAVVNVSDCIFAENHSEMGPVNDEGNAYTGGNGGGLYWNANNNHLETIAADGTVTVTNDRAGVTESKIVLTRCTFARNHAHRDGGGVYCEAKMEITACDFRGNSATRGGGIAQQVYNNKETLLKDDQATELKLDPDTLVHLNTATNGAGISIVANATGSIPNDSDIDHTIRFDLNGAQVYANTATENGGGIYFIALTYPNDAGNQAEIDRFSKIINIGDGLIRDNHAGAKEVWAPTQVEDANGNIVTEDKRQQDQYGNFIRTKSDTGGNGGGVYMSSSNNTQLTISGGNIYDNVANGGNGGGIYMTGKNATCVITGGTVGGTTTYTDATTNTTKTREAANKAAKGGGIAISGGANINMTGGTISYNAVNNAANSGTHSQGGGIWLDHIGDETDSIANTMTLTGGTITNNTTAGGNSSNGGGVFIGESGVITIEDGTITNNSAGTAWGGGIYVYWKATAYVSGGTISGNTANSGGGVALEYDDARLYLEDGTISNNTANNEGGGGLLVNNGAYVRVSGGSITGNHAVCSKASQGNGGGVLLKGGSKINILGGDITNNDAYWYGGGIYSDNSVDHAIFVNAETKDEIIGAAPEGVTTASVTLSGVNISGGDITDNEAKHGNGGGVHVFNSTTATIAGGNIQRNKAPEALGGGVHAYQNSSVTITGGSIDNNSALGGGGLSAEENSSIIVKGGSIDNNTAERGGGIYVSTGAELEVKGGFIKQNKATGEPDASITTGYMKNTDLKGTGGGIYVVDGKSATDLSVFTLSGTDIGIYDNTADFAADDVFANGNNTKLNVPLVGDMNLTGYAFKAEGWFEDYAEDDSQYSIGTNPNPSTVTKVERYKKAETYRIEIGTYVSEEQDVLLANVENEYVCMTLGMTGAIADTIVVDFGIPVDIDVMKNDVSISISNSTIAGFSLTAPTLEGELSYTSTLDSSFVKTFTDAAGRYTICPTSSSAGETVVADTAIRFILNNMALSEAVTVYCAIEYNVVNEVRYYYTTLTIIPATSVYYEDNFVKYEVVDSNGNKIDGSWTEVTDNNFSEDVTQDGDRPGVDQEDALGNLDMDNVYGYDSHYASMSEYSLGSAMKIKVTSGKAGKASFSFWGTGFDVVSLSSNQTGVIVVKITKVVGDTTVSVANYMVDTYYGYSYVDSDNDGDKEWVVDANESDTLYQVPVIKVDLNKVVKTKDNAATTDVDETEYYGYGYYNVEIVASYSELFDHGKCKCGTTVNEITLTCTACADSETACACTSKTCTECFSYDFYLDAIRIYNPVSSVTGNVFDAYAADNEYLPTYEEIRDKLINAETFGALTEEETISGAVFIDGIGSSTIADYVTYGPNNEVYLSNGQAVIFDLNGTNIGSVQLGLKSIGTAKLSVYGWKDGVKTIVFEEKQINTATELYYAITAMLGHTVVIKNTGSGTLSLTNLKTTTSTTANTNEEGSSEMTVSGASINLALAGEKDPIVAEGTIAPEYATLTYEDEILLNIHFQLSGLDVSLENLGLMTYTADGNTLLDTIPGAVYSDGSYIVSTNPIAPKNLGDTVWFRVYAKLADGSYVYSNLLSYSPKTYATNILNNSENAEMKALVVSMLNYGAAAQEYFGYKTDALVNADLTAEQKALVCDYSADMIAPVGKVDSSKVGAFAANGGFGVKYPTVSLEGAFAINYYLETSYAMDGVLTLYYWNAEDYANAEILTAENATGVLVDSTTVEGIAAKDLDSTIYVAAVYESEGTSYCSGVLAYSVGAYCAGKADNSALAQAIAVYGYYAKAYFG